MQYKTEVGKSFGYNTQIKDLTIVTKPSYYYLTSTIYPLEFLDDLSTSVLNTNGRSSHKDDLGAQRFNQDTTSTSFTDISGTLKVALKVYEYSRTEEDIDKVQGSVSSVTGVLRLLLLSSTMKVENTLTSFTGISGVLRSALIVYNFYKQESTLSLITALEAIYNNVQTSFESYVKGTSTVYSYPVVMNNVMFTSTVQTMSFSASTLSTTDTSGYTLVFRDPLTEVDAKNVVLIFGREQSNLPKDPEVIINEYTTSALDFENDLIDKVSTTVWNKEGTGNVTSVNKIFGNNSFETKALGDSLYTDSNILTGGSTPFTIEFYALINHLNLSLNTTNDYPLFTRFITGSPNLITGLFLVNPNKSPIDTNVHQSLRWVFSNNDYHLNSDKIRFNEINKFTITYDGSALRFFVNYTLSGVFGTNSPFVHAGSYNLMSREGAVFSSTGLIDNINIFDGVATKVRDYDEHADKLVVDLAFDGKNNSTKIVDNGTEKLTWTVNGNTKLSTDKKFSGFSSLYIGSSVADYLSSNITDKLLFDKNTDMTIDFLFNKTHNSGSNSSLLQFVNKTVDSGFNRFSFFIRAGTNNLNICVFANGTTFIDTITNVNLNEEARYTYILKGGISYLYVNSKLISSVDSYYSFGYELTQLFIGQNGKGAESYSGYIKNLKIYKGVAVIPENPTGKIQLDFDNNLTDKYNNSTWTNNGVTFDQVNSVKGHAAYFKRSANSYISCANNENLNFQKLPFNISFDASIEAYNPNGWQDYICTGLSNSSPNNVSGLFYNNTNKISRLRLDRDNYFEVSTPNILNQYYNHNLSRTNNVFLYKINNVIQIAVNWVNDITYNWNNITRLGTASTGGDEYLTGKMDNFKSEKDYKGEFLIDKPAVHLPLETNAINTGFTSLTINAVGNPTYTTVDGKKCIKFESGKYLTINSNNIFNLGASSDFYLEVDFYVISLNSFNNIIRNIGSWTTTSSAIQILSNGIVTLYAMDNKTASSSNSVNLNTFNNLKVFRKGNITSITLNGIITELNNLSFNFSDGGSQIGSIDISPTSYLNGYMSNFKMFVGTSEIPETYNDKKVLNLDFKPTRKSYLFKDNNSKCIIHPVNITQRDYQDSKYCCTFNGTNQYLELGKNDLFNFGLDDFVINTKFRTIEDGDWNILLASNILGEGDFNYRYISIGSKTRTVPSRVHIHVGTNPLLSENEVNYEDVNDLTVVRVGTTLKIILNGIETVFENRTDNFNFNNANNTKIGSSFASNSQTHGFKGTIYSVKILRNTSDLTLLESEEESGGGEDNYTPITLSLNTPSTVENPVEGSYTNIYGVIRYADLLPTVTVMFNGNEVNQSDITVTSRGTSNDIEQDYDLQIRILNDALDGTYPVTVTVGDTFDVANGSTSLTVIRDYPLISQGLDSFNTSWYQLSTTNKVGTRNYQEEQMMYFNGLSSLTANGYSWKFGLDQFTIELDFALTKSPSTNNYHILSCGKTESWYAIEITSNREIRFLNRGTVKVSTTTNVISINTKYRLAITRDSNYNLRIFLNGIKVAESIDNSNYTFDEDTSDLNHNVFLGRVGTLYTDTVAEKHFKGYMKNFYFNKGVCLYTENYTPTVLDKGITTKSLLTFTSDDVGFTTKVDSFNPNITWTNSGCTVVNNQLVLGSVSNRLVSTENDLFNFTNQNWTIDIIGTTSQITTEAVLFDNRLSGSSFNGILIRQSPSDPTSLTISLGISTATTGYSYIINTGVNSLVANTEFNLKVVRSLGQLIVFLNGVRKNRTTIYTNSFETSKTVCIGNNKNFNKGFNGKIRQVRIINGIATDVHAYPVIEGDILT